MIAYAENVLYGNYIRYERMYQLTQHAFYKTNGNTADIYIDMNSFLRSLYRFNDIIFRSESIITSSVINFASHIRNYYWTRHHIYTRIFIVLGDNFPMLPRSNNSSYNQTSYSEYVTNFKVTDMIRKNIELMDILVPYIEDVFFVHDTEVETAVLIKTLMDKQQVFKQGISSVVFTKDPYCYQLVAMEPLVFVFRPKKMGTEDMSWVVSKRSLFDLYCHETHTIVAPETPIVHHELFSLILSMSGLRCRNIKGVMRFSTAMKHVYNAVHQGLLVQGYNVAFEIGLGQSSKIPQDKMELIKSNFKTLDLPYNSSQYNISRNAYALDKYIINLQDPETLKDINNRYFTNNPIDLMGF